MYIIGTNGKSGSLVNFTLDGSTTTYDTWLSVNGNCDVMWFSQTGLGNVQHRLQAKRPGTSIYSNHGANNTFLEWRYLM